MISPRRQAALPQHGFTPDEVRRIMDGIYARGDRLTTGSSLSTP